MPVMLAVYPLLTAAEYVVSACAGLLIGIGITDNPEQEILDDTAHASVAAGGRDISNDVKLGEAKANERIARITKSGVLARSTEKCELCPANTGTPTREKRSFGNDINLQYQIYITGAKHGPGWIEEWDFATVSFDGFQRSVCLLQETKGAYDQFFLDEEMIKYFWTGVEGIVTQARTQNAVVVATPPNKLSWYFMERLSFTFFSRLFMSRSYIISVYHIPYSL
ncbi:restriction endonuclease fold toxin 5 domain-containing protein [Photorhabdus australis]|uniref:restriction endonuclease fold toxin 5 domain-containing protein n=1 Tax=Photorhabdus australis TaxID=286156 RepID=UPI00069087DD|nr:restriction endonuclease fold toxin 5 domain-containing protein [Photorhabdus australis]